MSPGSRLLDCHGRRQGPLLWFLCNFLRPREEELPVSPKGLYVTSPQGELQSLRELDPLRNAGWFDKRQPWAAYFPVKVGPARAEWSCLFPPDNYEDEIEIDATGRPVISRELLAANVAVTQHLAYVLEKIKEKWTDNSLVPPPTPTPLATRADLAPYEVPPRVDLLLDIHRWRRRCIDVAAFIRFAETVHGLDVQMYAAGDADRVRFIKYINQDVRRQGVLLDVRDVTVEELEPYWDAWADDRVPVGFFWMEGLDMYDAFAPFDPAVVGNRIRIVNAGASGHAQLAVTERLGETTGLRLAPRHKAWFERQFYAESFSDSWHKVNVRVFYLNCPRPVRARLLRTEDPTKVDLIEPIPELSSQVLDFAEFVQYKVPELDIRVQMNAAGLNEFIPTPPPPLPPMPPVDMRTAEDPQLWEQAAATADDNAASTEPATAGESPRQDRARASAPQEHRSLAEEEMHLVRTLEDTFSEHDLFVPSELEPDILQGTALGLDSAFAGCCVATFPPATELRLLYHFLVNADPSRESLFCDCIRMGMPLRLQMADSFGDWYTDMRTEELQARGGIAPSTPDWAVFAAIPPLVTPRRSDPTEYAHAYRLSWTFLQSLPHLERLLYYGGIIWRLAIAIGGPDVARHLLKRPSDAWALYRVGPAKDARNRLYSETYDTPDNDPLAQAALGCFDGGLSLWPTHAEFIKSFKWKDAWTPALEAWFQAHLRDIQAGTVRPKSQASWRKEWARPPKPLRGRATGTLTADERAAPLIRLARDTGIYGHTVLEEEGRIDAIPAYFPY